MTITDLSRMVPCVCCWMLLSATHAAAKPPAVEAVDFEKREVYRPPTKPAYASWVSLFPGNDGEWYLSFEHVTQVDPPLPQSSLDHWYRMNLPDGYDKSPYLMEVVLLRSEDKCASWREISRQPVRYQHSASAFGQVRTRDGRFLRSMCNAHKFEEPIEPGRFLYDSNDDGQTWRQLPPLLDDRFAAFPHRMKRLRDGTIVLAVGIGPMWGPDREIPVTNYGKPPYAIVEMSMSLFCSHDDGRTWQGPLALFPGLRIAETDFVELPSGDLVAFAHSIYMRGTSVSNQPGRQVVYRLGDRLVPGLYEKCPGQTVPECVTMTSEGILVGSLRSDHYYWSDDEGRTWNRLAGAQACGYQPEIHQLSDGRIVCAWHRGADDAIATADQFVGIDLFRLKINRRTAKTNLTFERQFDPGENRFLNEYVATLTSDGAPLLGKTVVLWYATGGDPGWELYNRGTIVERMALGAKTIAAVTDERGRARISLPEMEAAAKTHGVHYGYQMAMVFNADRSDPDYLPAASAICSFYALKHGNDPSAGTHHADAGKPEPQ